MAIWAITGGIASGKSTVANVFEQQHVRRYSADDDARDVMNLPTVQAAIEEKFPSCFTKEHTVIRDRLADCIYKSPELRLVLGEIMHPHIRQRMRSVIDLAQINSMALHIYEVPLLFEGNLQTWFDGVVCVACDLQTQRDRIRMRQQNRYGRSITDTEIDQMLASQMDIQEKIAQAQIVINTSRLTREETVAAVRTAIKAMHKQMLESHELGQT